MLFRSIVPAIVSEELWDKANAVLKKRSEDVKGRQGICNHANLLTGKLYCTHCGAAYLWERGFVTYDDSQRDDPDMLAGIDQTLAFEKGMRGHDDAPDADEGAIWILQRDTRVQSFTPSFGMRKTAKNILW